MDHVRQNEIQGRNMVFFKAHAYSISFCLTYIVGGVKSACKDPILVIFSN